MIVWRLSFTSNGRNAILIEESSWLLEWNRTIHHPIDLSIITCAMCNTVMLHGWCSCIYGKFKSTRFIRFYFVLEFFTIEYMFNIYIDICLSIEFEFVYSNFWISFEGDDANESFLIKKKERWKRIRFWILCILYRFMSIYKKNRGIFFNIHIIWIMRWWIFFSFLYFWYESDFKEKKKLVVLSFVEYYFF